MGFSPGRWPRGLAPLAVAAWLVVGCGEATSVPPQADAALPTTGVIQGLVTDRGGSALAAAEVSTTPSSGFAVSDATGGYSLSGVAAGTYAVRATRQGFMPLEKQATVSAGGVALVDFALESAAKVGAVAGLITDSKTSAPVAGATVTTAPATASKQSGADGKYHLDLEAGAYQVKVAASGYEDRLSDPVTVQEGQTTTLNLQLVAVVTYPSQCAACHLDSERLLADLTANPPPETGESGSAGEG